MKSSTEIRQILYLLKQSYGFPTSIYYRGGDSVDLRTGLMTVTETVYQIKKAIVLPYSLFNKFFKHGEFNYGGDLEIERRIFIIDRHDIPTINIINNDQWYIFYNHKRYSIETIDNYEYRQCYFITAKELTGTEVAEQHIIQVTDSLLLSDGFVHPTFSIVDTLSISSGVT